jgi:hypothetical protein
MTKIYHQLGHRYKWNLESYRSEQTGNGVIIAPRYIDITKVRDLPSEVRDSSIFDPQFYLPQSSKGKLESYSFYPHILSGGFSTGEWDDSTSKKCANDCLSFQIDCEFPELVIPTRFYDGMPTNFISNQEALFVTPFLESYVSRSISQPLYLQIILTDQMIKDESYRYSLLNWLTSYQEIDGIYLIYYVNNRPKQLIDIEFLLGLFEFISALKNANMAVYVGYTNTESLLLLCLGVDVITIGSYENLRMFSLKAFEESENKKMRGPNARIYIPRLMQWIDYQYLGAIKRIVNNIDDYVEDNMFRVAMFSPSYNWHFSKSEPYKHYFISFYQQFQRLAIKPRSQILDSLIEECQKAIEEFKFLESNGIVFAQESSGNHLSTWLTVLNLWKRKITATM